MVVVMPFEQLGLQVTPAGQPGAELKSGGAETQRPELLQDSLTPH
jgi:hypothetical protein